MRFAPTRKPRLLYFVLLAITTITSCGCYAPLVSPGVEARDLPEEFRTPVRGYQNRLNLAELTIPKREGEVGPGDLLSVHVHGMSDEPNNQPLQVRVLEDGTIDLPLIGSVSVAGKTLPAVRNELVRTYERGKFLKSAQVSVQMIEAAMVQVVVIGEVNTPGVYTMPRNMADVGRAIAMAGGMTEFAGDAIEVHSNSQALFDSHASQLHTPTTTIPMQPAPTPLSPIDTPEPVEVLTPAAPDDHTDEEVRSTEPAKLNIQAMRETKSSFQLVAFERENSDSFEIGGFTLPKPSGRRNQRIVRPTVTTTPGPVRPASAEDTTYTRPVSVRTQTQTATVAVPLILQNSEPEDVAQPVPTHTTTPQPQSLSSAQPLETGYEVAPYHTCIALAGNDVRPLTREEVRLRDGDVITIPKRKDDVFYVVGPLNNSNRTSFNVGTRDLRQLGSGFLLPRDRDIDVVTGVAMAGYIDPINSPTTVTVHRRLEDGRSLLIRVNLIEARYDRLETVMLRPGDIVYLNPDAAWWSRRYFDQVSPDLFRLPWRFWTQDWILGGVRSQGL